MFMRAVKPVLYDPFAGCIAKPSAFASGPDRVLEQPIKAGLWKAGALVATALLLAQTEFLGIYFRIKRDAVLFGPRKNLAKNIEVAVDGADRQPDLRGWQGFGMGHHRRPGHDAIMRAFAPAFGQVMQRVPKHGDMCLPDLPKIFNPGDQDKQFRGDTPEFGHRFGNMVLAGFLSLLEHFRLIQPLDRGQEGGVVYVVLWCDGDGRDRNVFLGNAQLTAQTGLRYCRHRRHDNGRPGPCCAGVHRQITGQLFRKAMRHLTFHPERGTATLRLRRGFAFDQETAQVKKLNRAQRILLVRDLPEFRTDPVHTRF